jgi:hypothetical protein
MRALSIAALIQLLMVGSATTVWGYDSNYGPFEKNQHPKLFPIHECDVVWQAPDTDPNSRAVTVFGKKNIKSMPSIRISDVPKVPSGTVIEVLNSSGDVLFGPKPISEFCGYVEVHWADLNHDGRQDFIIFDWSMGCGLAAGDCDVTFVLSKKDTYNITTIFTMFPDMHDFVDIKGNGTCQFIHTSFLYGDKAKDGKEHNYWVYNLLDITGSRVVLNNNLDNRFPKWVWYSFKPNHSETNLLTKEQKQKLWCTHSEKIFLTTAK